MTNNLNPQLRPKGFLKTIGIIHLALLTGQVLFAVVAFTQVSHSKFDVNNTGDPLTYIVPLMAISSFIASNYMFKQQLTIAVNKDSLNGKLAAYQTALIIRFALLEGASLFGIVTFLISGNLFFLLISGLLMLYFLSIRPTKAKMENDLNLSFQAKLEFDNFA